MYRLLFCLFCIVSLPVAAAGRSVDVYGQSIHYVEAGSGPPVILLHGLWGGLNEWQPVLDALSEEHRVIAMDFPGFHDSDKPEVRYHNALLAQFLAGFIDALALRNVTLIGHAMGANAATYTAVHHSQNIAALVLVDGAGYRNPERDLAQPPSTGMLGFLRTAQGSTLATTRGLLERRVADKSLVTDVWVAEAYAMWMNSARAIGDMLREGGDVSEEEMRGIELPTLVVWGAEDRVFSPEFADRLADDIAGAEVHVTDNAGHLPQVEQPDTFLDAVLPFLDQLSQR